MNQTNEIWQDLIISLLSVNGWSVDKNFKYKDALNKSGLFNPENLNKWDVVEIGNKMKESGYDRGGVTWIISERLSALGKFVVSKGVAECDKILLSKNKEKITEFLLPIKGVGNKVLESYFILAGI
jgi:hypothetical protein